MIYLGIPGRMVGIKCPAQQQVSFADRISTSTTLEGKVKAQIRPVGRRTWQASLSAASDPTDIGTVLGFLSGEWGAGPFWFVSADAPLINLMTPDESLCIPDATGATVSAGGPVQIDGVGWAGKSYQNSNPSGDPMLLSRTSIPVRHGSRVTGSAWVLGAGAFVRLHWYAADDSYLGLTLGAATTEASKMSRVHVTGTPPSGAATCRLLVSSALQVARPAVTWSDSVLPWGAGEGCPRAVLHGGSKDVTMAVADAVYGSISFTITEVG